MSRLDEIEARAENWTLFAEAHERDELSSWFWDDDVVKSLNEARKIKNETALLVRTVRQLAKGSRYKYGRLDGDTWVPYDPDILELIENPIGVVANEGPESKDR